MEVQAALDWLKENSTPEYREGLARYGIVARKAFGVSVANIQLLAKQSGRDHDLAAGLWKSGWYEARLLASLVDEPQRATPAQMDRWCRDFDTWGVCDTVCFHLFDRTPHAWAKVNEWSDRPKEFEKRAAFALLASLAGHNKSAGDEAFREGLFLIERAATDDRNFVKKGVSWALRRIGRRNDALFLESMRVAKKLAACEEAPARWIGKDALRDLTKWRDSR